MTFIDWSDPEEMLGLLTEYVADARSEAETDPVRARSLGALLNDLTQLTRRPPEASLDEAISGLRRIVGTHAEDLGDDPVLRHVEDCIEELVRIRGESGERLDGGR